MLMTLIIIAYLALCLAICFLKKAIPFLVVAGFVFAWYLFCYTDHKVAGVLLFVLMCITETLYQVAVKGGLEGSHKKIGEKANKKKEEDCASSNWVFYLVPIFWPFLIARILMSGKTRPTDMTPYNYKQHLKSNVR